ncbi:carbohydrate ABC transporter permease [Lacticaseibacillus paracasei]|uniref:Sugar ABC transporter permease n=1 Tax=Lacticaseibacillus paracasei TaxID=1597 RepID=A0ABD5CZJ8_LACPA|nr:sugar ABC transporter permease [Lacticaseibacillus paracasei]MDR7625278.1 sugar ABC transporter permease [Lacticaseibacillus paracasei]WMX60207.1 sugar ABC transporter permease [Lacticaseibacillus paracasei]
MWFVIPAILGLYYSFTNSDGNPGERFIGLANYQKLFVDPSFYKALFRTFTYVICEVPLLYIVSLLVAVLLSSDKVKGKIVGKIVVFLPWCVSGIVTGVMWKWLFGQDFGFINYVLQKMGQKPIPWFSNGNTAFMVIVIAGVWAATAFNMLLFMNAIKNVPTSLYEAAELDGASSFDKFWHITVPAIRPTSFMVIMLATIGAMKEFVMVQALTDGGPGTDNMFIVQYIYTTGFDKSNVGYASAVSMVLFVILLILALIQMKVGGGTNE